MLHIIPEAQSILRLSTFCVLSVPRNFFIRRVHKRPIFVTVQTVNMQQHVCKVNVETENVLHVSKNCYSSWLLLTPRTITITTTMDFYGNCKEDSIFFFLHLVFDHLFLFFGIGAKICF